MPRVYLTEADRRQAAIKRLDRRRGEIVRMAAAKKGVSLRKVAQECGVCYASLTRRVKGEQPFDLPTLTALTGYFGFDPTTALALLGGDIRSPYEL